MNVYNYYNTQDVEIHKQQDILLIYISCCTPVDNMYVLIAWVTRTITCNVTVLTNGGTSIMGIVKDNEVCVIF